MKILIFRKDSDESVYYKLNSEEDKTLNFDNIKDLAKIVLQSKSQVNEEKVEIEVSDQSLDLYKVTLENVLKSVNEDKELYEMFKSQNENNVEISAVELGLEIEENKND